MQFPIFVLCVICSLFSWNKYRMLSCIDNIKCLLTCDIFSFCRKKVNKRSQPKSNKLLFRFSISPSSNICWSFNRLKESILVSSFYLSPLYDVIEVKIELFLWVNIRSIHFLQLFLNVNNIKMFAVDKSHRLRFLKTLW